MHTLKRIRLRDVLMYRNVDIKFNAPIYTVRGLNRDRKQRNAANAAGKTFLFSVLPTVWFGAPPSSDRKNTAKSIHGKNSSIEITTRDNDGEKIIVTQASTGRSLKMTVGVHGKEYDYRELKKAKEHVAHLIPSTEDQYYAFNYIATRKFHPLLDGKAAQRFEFFESVYDFDMHDAVHERLSAMHSDMRITIAALKRQEERYAQEKKDNPSSLDLESAKATQAALSQASKTYSEKYAEAVQRKQAASTYLSVVGDDSTDGLSLSDLESELANCEKTRRRLKDELQSAREIETKAEAYKSSKKLSRKLQEKLAEDFSTVDTSILTKKNERRVGLIDQLRRLYKRNKEKRVECIEIIKSSPVKQLQDELGDDYIKNATEKKREAAHRKEIVAAAQLSRLSDVKIDEDGQCIVCGSKVSRAHIKEEKERWSKRFNDARLLGTRLHKSLKLRAALDEIDEAGETGGRCFNRMQRIEFEIKKLDKLRYQLERAREKLELEKELERVTVERVDPPKIPVKELEASMEKIEVTIRELDRRKRLAEALDALDKTYDSVADAKAAKKKAQERADKYSDLLETTQTKLDKLTTRIIEAETVQKSLKTLRKQIEDDKEATRDFSVIEGLRDAYGSRGIRLDQIETHAKKYIERMNAIAHLMFPEPIEFSYRISKNAFDILATRNTRGKRAEDVRSLSGSEAGAFKALSVLALMPSLPSSKRFGFIIFDEIEANMDKPTRDLLVREYLPVLTKVVPLVIFITPKSKAEFLIPRSKELLVIKKDGVATVSEG